MEFRLISDMHLECVNELVQYEISYIPGDKDRILIIAGDFVTLKNPQDASNMLAKLSKRFRYILYVPGNHEYYRGRIDPIWAERRFALLNGDNTNVHFLMRKSIVIDGIRFVGATLWTNMDKANPIVEYTLKTSMNDFKLITYYNDRLDSYSKYKPHQWLNEHQRDLMYIRETVDASTEPCVVITHHAPSAQSIDPRFSEDHYGNFGYHSVLDQFILDRPNIRYWCHGHIHKRSDYKVGDTNILCNPYGYPDEDIDFLDGCFYDA